MKCVILCGGLGTRLAEETSIKPKPMVEIGDMPILWHIMKLYDHFGLSDFILPLGYKGDFIKKFFLDYHLSSNNINISLKENIIKCSNDKMPDWKIDLIDTGCNTLTGGRLHRLENILRPTGTFMLTYGDGVADIDINKLIAFHKSHGKLATVTAVRPVARFGAMEFEGDFVRSFKEKPQTGEGWINGGFFVFEPGVFDYLDGDMTILEREPLERLARDHELCAFKHGGFWQCMDTIRDRDFLREQWDSNNAKWNLWSRIKQNKTELV